MTLVRSVVLAAFVALAGCTAPSEPRSPPPDGQAIRAARDSALLAAEPREELAGPERRAVRDAVRIASLSPEQKEALFRDFDDYLRRPGSHHADTSAPASTSSRPPAPTSQSPPRLSSHRRP